MEGLGARFSSYLEKRADFPPGSSSKGAPAPGAGGNWPEHHPNASYRYPGHFQQQQPMTSTYNMPPRKRSSPSSSVLPPKKQHMDSAGVDYSFHKGKPILQCSLNTVALYYKIVPIFYFIFGQFIFFFCMFPLFVVLVAIIFRISTASLESRPEATRRFSRGWLSCGISS